MSSTPRKGRAKSIGHYVVLKTIGEGTFGKVKLGTHILTGEQVAVKVLEKERIVDIADVERVAREIHILKLIRHPHIIQLYEIIETPRQLYLIMEYASGGELFDYIVQHGRAKEPEACRFLHQILAGIEQVHSMHVVHRDLKPENLLLDERRDIKIVDFGLSNTHQVGQLLQTACGSPCYAAPEMIAGHQYEPSMVDIWSCGVILFALVCGYLPFEDQNTAELYNKILNAEYEIPNFVSPEVSSLIAGMLTTDPGKRLTIEGIRWHPWYRQIPEASIRLGTPDFRASANQQANGKSTFDEELLQQLENYGFARDYAVKCLQTNKHNHVTTTYYLLYQKKVQKPAGSGSAFDLAIMDLDATCLDERDEIGQLVSGRTLATAATPSRSSRGSHLAHANMRRPSAGVAESSRATIPHGMPRLGLTELDRNGQSRGAGQKVSSDVSPGGRGLEDVGHARSARQPLAPQQPQENQGPYSSRGSRSDGIRGSVHTSDLGYDPPLDYPPPGSGRRYMSEGPSSRPRTARTRSSENRWPVGNSNSGLPYGREAELRWQTLDEPLSARPPYGCSPYDVPPSAWGGQLTDRGPRTSQPPYLGGTRQLSARGSRTSRPALSARGTRDSYAQERHVDQRRTRQNSLQDTYSSSRPPQQIMSEVLRALASHQIQFRHVSAYLVRCQCQSIRFETEVLQAERGAPHILQFSHVSGDVWQYKDVCAQLLSEVHL